MLSTGAALSAFAGDLSTEWYLYLHAIRPQPRRTLCRQWPPLATFFNGNGDLEQHDVRLPYMVTINRPSDGYVSISGWLNGDGTVTCQITSGGHVVASTTSTGEFVGADCSGSV